MMTYVRTVRLYCDGCGQTLDHVFNDGDAYHQRNLLELARKEGWEVDEGHWCPDCLGENEQMYLDIQHAEELDKSGLDSV